jgi:protein O-mannosyl-transferase
MSGKTKKKVKTRDQNPKQVKPSANKKDLFSGIPKWLPIVILVFTALIYVRAMYNGFLTCWDDDGYILNNPYLKNFSFDGIKAIFTNFYYSNYHPLTTLTYLFEYKLYGLNAMPYHLFNVIIHLLNTWLVFRLAEKLSGIKVTAIVVAVLFALHPMHVESVAWISERKDVLYTLFYLLSLLAYLRYMKSVRKTGYYFVVLLFFLASLLSKVAAVTLPVLLVAIDIYKGRKITFRTLIEKVPFFLLSLLFGILTISSQRNVDAFNEITLSFSFIDRVFLFSYSIIFYIFKLIVPVSLSAMYYFPDVHKTLPWQYYASLPALILIIFLVIRRTSYRKEMLFGVFFFLITISVMLQIVPVGNAHMAERYTYVPYLGLIFIAGQMISRVGTKKLRNIVITLFSIYVAVISYQTLDRIGMWKNGNILFTDVIKKNPEVYHGYWVRGNLKNNENDFQGALQDYNKTLEYAPDYVLCLKERAGVYDKLGNYTEALKDIDRAINMDTTIAEAYDVRGIAYYGLRNMDSALINYNHAIALDPEVAKPFNNRGVVKAEMGDFDGAMKDINMSITLSPNDAEAYRNRGSIKNLMKDYKGSIEDYDFALKLKPDDDLVYYNRGVTRLKLKDSTGACEDWKKAVTLGNKGATEAIKLNCK